MGKFMLKDTQRELGISPYQAICRVGARVNDKYNTGNVAIVFDEIMGAQTFINAKVLRQALLENPAKTARLLKIKVSGLGDENIVAPPAPVVEYAVIEEADDKIHVRPVVDGEVIDTPIETVIDYSEEETASDVEELTTEISFDIDVDPALEAEISEPTKEDLEAEVEDEDDEYEEPIMDSTPGVDLAGMNKADLVSYGKEQGVELEMKMTRDTMIDLLSE